MERDRPSQPPETLTNVEREHLVILPLFALDGVNDERLRAIMEAEAERPKRARRWLHCLNCRRRITREDDRVSYLGLDVHTRTNPYGITFRFGSFGAAEGCEITGDPVAAFTWFAGYYWRIALCGGCGVHLGWKFENAESCFYGLVLNRLSAQDNGH